MYPGVGVTECEGLDSAVVVWATLLGLERGRLALVEVRRQVEVLIKVDIIVVDTPVCGDYCVLVFGNVRFEVYRGGHTKGRLR